MWKDKEPQQRLEGPSTADVTSLRCEGWTIRSGSNLWALQPRVIYRRPHQPRSLADSESERREGRGEALLWPSRIASIVHHHHCAGPVSAQRLIRREFKALNRRYDAGSVNAYLII